EIKERSPLLPAHSLQAEYSNNYKESLDTQGEETIPREAVFKVYKRRWYILTLYTAIALNCNMAWNAWGPISEPCKIIFGWGNWQVLFLASWAATSLILSAVPSTYLMDMKGLRKSVISCASLLTAGKVFQVIPSSDPLTRTILLNIGQCISMLSTPVGLGAPPSISATWFPPEERTTATAISTLVAYIGLPVAFIIGPYMVQILEITYSPQTNNTMNLNVSISNYTKVYDIDAMSSDLTKHMGVHLGISMFLLVCALLYFPDKPPLPPCETSGGPPHEYGESIQALLFDRSYLHLVVIFALSYGVYFGWISVLALAVKPFGVDESLAGWLGASATTAGIFSGLCLAR
ncbi:solute carrier family 49 member 4-like, partial [Actinia tenebrosa]|uniref:Solute carrier family 49 member 4-like n=1 Tax=Actinia tenebrosa TaxID=6105 RepID=A0A6P8ILY2_ACTTE